MSALTRRVFLLIVLIGICQSRKLRSRLTNIKCTCFDKSFEFRKCELKVINRGVVGASIFAKVLQLPLPKIKMNVSAWRRVSGYRPFIYNETMDICDLLAQKRKFSFLGLVMGSVMKNSNLNHTCPINHDIIIDKYVFLEEYLQNLPLPQGDFKFEIKFFSKLDLKAEVDVFLFKDEI